ncbi:PREDICTED: uncharacterized protein LOC105461857, partial [Wasmannia auropunctata]|uniref:uncharacterized protein LOC105461857 n=1 Tax=Wasmannia auropunctata TaxID=64793 RepID=UPI0005F00F69
VYTILFSLNKKISQCLTNFLFCLYISTVYQDIPSETDILLQKVSDTLSNVLPTSSSPISESLLPLGISYTSTQTNVAATPNGSAIKLEESVGTKDESNEFYTSCNNLSIENALSVSTPNITTVNSQQDTSDYVSAMGEDLSISDWEYQLPAPPSAFRDSHSPTFDDYDTVMLGSVEAFKEPAVSPVTKMIDVTDNSNKNLKSIKNLSNNVEVNCDKKASNEKMDFVSEIDIKQMMNKLVVKQRLTASQKSETDSDLRKEIISELENKIETSTLAPTINKDFDRRNIDNLSAPELAPVDNTLSNFTITTYTKQKSLDIFDEFEESNDYTRNSEERFIKTFATLSRNNANTCNHDKKSETKNTHNLINNLSHKKTINKSEESNPGYTDYKMEPKIRDQGELSYKRQSLNTINDKTNIQRSKSYISMSNNIKYHKEEINTRKYEPQIEPKITGIKKAISINDLNVDTLKGNEKFSQWRDNILKNQEEPTKEKQLQSLQVLKSILPQLKNAQQAEENVSKDHDNVLSIQRTNRYEAESNEHSVKMNVVPTRESRNFESQPKHSLKEESTKRYVYAGPPAISLGSWSERPSVNVQIKMDTDYKLGRSNTINGSKTIVNINNTKNEKDIANYTDNIDKIVKHEFSIDSLANKNPDELIAKKLITHTTVSNFKISNGGNTFDLTKNEDKPVVMGVELKRISVKTPREMLKSDENEVDITPTKTFGQYANFTQHLKRTNINKYSADYCNAQPNETERITNSNVKENGNGWVAKTTNQNDFSFKNQSEMHGVQQNSQPKRFTSVIGVNRRTSQNLGLQSEMPYKCNVNNAVKINPLMPVVKGFKISTADSKTNNNQINHNGLSAVDSFKNVQPPKPPTMPVITGVTLKNANARPKSIQLNPRDMLLESIRNFGGREKLKSTTERY